ncbi:hypothetical protein [Paenibacillus sp. LjRoot56]
MKKWMPLLLARVVMVSAVGCSKGSTEPNGSSASGFYPIRMLRSLM